MAHKKLVWLLALVTVLALVSTASPWSLAKTPSPQELDGPVVVRLYFETRDQLNAVAGEHDVWEVHHDLGYAVISLYPEEYRSLLALGYRMEIDAEKTQEIRHPLGIPGYPCYRTVAETEAALQTVATTYPTLTDLLDIGDSWEKLTPGGLAGYDIWRLRITNEAIAGPKPTFFLMAEIHAREYTTAETAMRFAEYVLDNYGTNPEITFFVDYYNIDVVPLTNPDGRVLAEGGADWRKNTDNDDGCSTPSQWGTDLNRNHSFKWGCCGGSSGNPCSLTYRGPSAGSEPEVQTVENYVLSIFPDQRGPGDTDPAPLDATGLLITLHSYSELVLWPWGWTFTDAPNHAQLQMLGTKMATYNDYTPQQSADLYFTDGTTDDWAYGALGIAAYTFEMGTSFFQSCTPFESTIWPDNRDALLYAMKVPETPYMTSFGPDALNAAVTPASVPQGTQVQLTGTINDQTNGNQAVQAAEYFVLPLHGPTPPGSPGTGTAMQPADGNWNSTVENVVATVNTAALAPGDYIIAVRGRDLGNNWGPFTAVFVNVTTGSDPEQIGLDASPLSIPIVYGESTVTATLTLMDGTPVPGWEVAFSTDLGTVDPATAISDMSGHAVTTLTAGAAPGTAHVSAEATAALVDSVDVEIYTPAAPGAAFASNSPVCIGSPVVFDNQTSFPAEVPIEYEWTFGDGLTSTDPSPQHLYAAGGTYDVSLTATNVGGSDVATGTVTVDPVPEAGFTWAPLSPRPAQPVQFTDTSTYGPILQWQWNFGDGGGSGAQNPAHAFASAGSFPVTLRARNSCGWSPVYEQTVVVSEGPQFAVYLPVVFK